VPAKVKDVYLAHLVAGVGGGEDAATTTTTTTTTTTPPPPRSAIIFCDTTRGAAALAATLGELGLRCAALHSRLKQPQRLAALAAFRGARVPLLVATDVGSRGLDIPTVDLVVNYDVPSAPEDYVHRVGRTARAGRGGRAVTLVTQHDVDLVHAIEARVGHMLTEAAVDERDVLKGMSRVFKARRAAALAAADAATVAAARQGARG
jgi:ATP-dependent RNA helicase DDX49/DBP8